MSLLDPPKDHLFQQQPAPHEQHGEPQKGSTKAATSQSPPNNAASNRQAAAKDTLDGIRPGHERSASTPRLPSGLKPNRPALAARAISEPSEVLRAGPKRGLIEATESLQTFETLRTGTVHDPNVAKLCQALLPLTDHAEGFKAFTLTGADGQVMGATQMHSDLTTQGQVAHPTLARRVSMMVRQLAEGTHDLGTWHAVAKLLIGSRPLPVGFTRAGTRLLRRGDSFLLEASTAYGLPELTDPAFIDLARMHAVFLHHVGATAVAPSPAAPMCAAMCTQINMLLTGFARSASFGS